jgi:hypothetical protein
MREVHGGSLDAGRVSLRILLGVSLAAALLGVLPAAQADDAYWSGSISGVGPGSAVDVEHHDLDPFKGFLFLTVQNSGSQPWGDFHFQIYDPMGGQDISNVGFLDSTTVPPGPNPTSSQSPLTWTINNVIVGATCDLYFYSNPVMPGNTATFTVYTSNPDHLSFFGVMLYPTPVPEPVTLLSLALGALLLRRR